MNAYYGILNGTNTIYLQMQTSWINIIWTRSIPELRTHMRDIYEEEYLVFNVQCFANDVIVGEYS